MLYTKKSIERFRFNILSLIIILCLCWEPLQIFLLGIDGAGRIPFILLIIGNLIAFNNTKIVISKKPVVIYLFLVIYMFANGLLKESHMVFTGGIFAFITIVFSPVLLMLLVLYNSRINFNETLKIICVGLYLYCVMAMFSDATKSERFGSLINANIIGLNAMFCVFSLLFLWLRKCLSLPKLIVFLILPMFVIILTGSRTSFALVSLVVFCTFLMSRVWNARSLFFIFCLIAIFVLGFKYIIDNTVVGERLMGTTTQIEDSKIATGTVWDILGDRGIQYYISWNIFLQNPITGIGLRRWSIVGGTGVVFHSEYLVQYCENGIIGISLYLCFLSFYVRKLFRMIKDCARYSFVKRNAIFLLLVFTSILFTNFAYWTYTLYCCFVYYALIYSYLKDESIKDMK